MGANGVSGAAGKSVGRWARVKKICKQAGRVLPCWRKLEFMMANVMIVGRVGQAPESRQVGDKTVWKFSVATSRGKKLPSGEWENITDWHSCQYWGNLSAGCGKGALVVLNGRLEAWKSGDKSGWQVVVSDLKVITKSETAAAAPEPAVSQEQLDSYTKSLNEKFGEVKISKIDDNELPF